MHNPPDDPHRCIPIDTDDAAFEGLKKGKDYQICPSERCGMKIQLSAACNEMSCPCGTQFCYVCGEAVSDKSEHWTKEPDGCPRFNQPGAPNAHFDPPVRRLRIRFPPPNARRNPLHENGGGTDHGLDGVRFAGLRIRNGVGPEQTRERPTRNPLWPVEEERRFHFDDPRNRVRALVITRLHALGGERRNAIVDAIMDVTENEDGNGDGHDQP